jgi:predicted nucleic acid-binding protein
MMNAPRSIDSNVLLYSISRDPAEAAKSDIAIALLDTENLALSVQVLQEFYVQATRATRPDALAHEIAVGLLRTWLRFIAGDHAIRHDQRARDQGDLSPILLGCGDCGRRARTWLPRAALRGHEPWT